MADFDKYPEAFRAFGIEFTEEPGWRNRGHGDFIPKNGFVGVVIHHTASANNDAAGINPVRDGVSGLPGPLSQLVLRRDGRPHIVAQGVAWHAGYGPSMWGAPEGNGNYYLIGIEGIDSGYNTWTDVQRREYPRVVAALLKYNNLPPDRWIFHRDYNRRDGKIDPGGFTKEWFAAEVNKHYNGTSKPAETAIQAKRRVSSWLGNKTTAAEELATPDGVGRFTYYENGAIYWTASTGACALSNEMVERYSKAGYEAGELGYPTTDVFQLPDGRGRAQVFQNGSIYYSPEYGAKIVKGRIGSKWAEYGWENSLFGYPKTEEEALPDTVGRVQEFEGGKIYWQPSTDSHPVYGLIGEAYDRIGAAANVGYPKIDEADTQDRNGRYQKFEFGTAYWKKGQTSAFVVENDFMELFGNMGYEVGRLGYPISDEQEIETNTYVQHFEGGDIKLNRLTKEVCLHIDGEEIKV